MLFKNFYQHTRLGRVHAQYGVAEQFRGDDVVLGEQLAVPLPRAQDDGVDVVVELFRFMGAAPHAAFDGIPGSGVHRPFEI